MFSELQHFPAHGLGLINCGTSFLPSFLFFNLISYNTINRDFF